MINSKAKREPYLDFLRGVAVIAVVFIHTTFGLEDHMFRNGARLYLYLLMFHYSSLLVVQP